MNTPEILASRYSQKVDKIDRQLREGSKSSDDSVKHLIEKLRGLRNAVLRLQDYPLEKTKTSAAVLTRLQSNIEKVEMFAKYLLYHPAERKARNLAYIKSIDTAPIVEKQRREMEEFVNVIRINDHAGTWVT